ncbi:unnamed protein product [Ophioblennius macclurei]
MGKGKDLSDDVKNQIVSARQLGRSLSETARLAGCSRAAVARIYQQWSRDGKIGSRRQGVGRPRLIDKRGLRRLSRLVQNNSTATVAQVAQHFNDGYGKNVSEHTVHRALLRMGLRSRRSVALPALTPAHWHKRLQWAREHRGWSAVDWKKVAWSGASRFLLQRADGSVRVRRECAQDIAPAPCTVERRRADEDSVMLWAMFSWETLGCCVCLGDGATPAAYFNVVADHVHTFMSAVFPDGGGIFQQDAAPCPTVRDWFDEHADEFKVLAWPPNSSDLNPISHLWDALEERVQAAKDPPRNVEELKELLVASWYLTAVDSMRGVVEAMPARIAALLGVGVVPAGPDAAAAAAAARTHSITADCRSNKDQNADAEAEWLANYAFSLCQSSLLAGAYGEDLDLGTQNEAGLVCGGHGSANMNTV